jgi:threonylcarbamoyladenosine tRNA methylthiotransferase MtaB
MLRYRITTLGCKVNQYEGQALGATLAARGLQPARSSTDPIDLLIVNTCCITTTAMRKSRQAIRREVRENPQAGVLITGCYSEYDRANLADILAGMGVPPRRRGVAGHHQDVAKVLDRLVRTLEGRCPATEPIEHRDQRGGGEAAEARGRSFAASIKRRRQAAAKPPLPAGTSRLDSIRHFAGHQRAFVKVQDGCDAFCAYCIVPYMRPRIWSRQEGEILDECRALIDTGHREIVLCGVFLGAYGRDTAIRRRWPDAHDPLARLVEKVAALPGLWRVRLSSLEPGDLSDHMLEALANENVAPHLHLPLQSGSARILRRMNRQYDPDQFLAAAERLRGVLDRPAITSDIIVGFPGESDEDFAATLDVARKARLSRIHAFGFSAIEPTTAWRYRHESPPPKLVKDRMNRLAETEQKLARRYRRQFVGETLEVLVETVDSGFAVGTSQRYMTIRLPAESDRAQPGTVIGVRIEAVTEEGLAATAEQVDS